MKKILILFMAFSVAFGMQAQKDNNEESTENLVPNGDFETADSKSLKKTEMLDEVCEEWESGSRAMADLFSAYAKSDKINVPDNVYGSQEALSGGNYAGFRAYTKDSKLSRTYITVELSDAMEENQQYCVKFNVSLADLSKYSVNGLGMYISNKQIVQPNTNDIIKDAQIMHQTNKQMADTEGWETICGTFTSTGKEKYIIIGCFEADGKLNIEKVRKPSGIAGSQEYHAYYYIDDVEITPIQAQSQCVCSALDSKEPEVIYSRNLIYTDDMSLEEKINQHAVYFAALKTEINVLNKADLNKLIEILQLNPSVKINVIGHCTDNEIDEARINSRFKDLGLKRAQAVEDYLKSKGISADRMEVSSLNNTSPANTRTTPLSVAQNRRVVISVK